MLSFILALFLTLAILSADRRRAEKKARSNIKWRTAEEISAASAPKRAEVNPKQPYLLKENELPQGTYTIGQDIPPGTYDFFVVYGTGGKLDICKRDASGKIIDGTLSFYWVGLKETYEKREVIHVSFEEGYTVEIGGNVILRIAKSQKVKINL